MKSYEQLTLYGKNLRLRKLCIKALEAYPIDVACPLPENRDL